MDPLMYRIREDIKNHLEISDKLHLTANQLLRDAHEPGFQKKIGVVARDNKLPAKKLRRKVYVLQEKQAYYEAKFDIERMVNNYFNNVISLSRDKSMYIEKMSMTRLTVECKKREKLGSSYQYEQSVKPGTGVFTYLEEVSLLDKLNIWINSTQDKCHCQVCSLVHIMKIAYELAKRDNKKYETYWNIQKQANLEWIYDYEMRHYDEISKLEGPNSCLLKSQASAVTQQEAIPSTSRGHLQEAIPSTSRGHLQEAIPSTSRGHLQEAIPSTSRGHLPGDIEQEQDHNVHIRESIKKHIQLSDTLSKAADEILYDQKDIIDIALSYDLDVWILQRKVEILKRTNDYLEKRFHRAANNYILVEYNNQSIEQYVTTCINMRNIEPEFEDHLIAECQRFVQKFNSDESIYEYNKITISYEIFTSSQEEEILKQLYEWQETQANASQCHCILCAMEQLLSLAYQFAEKERITYPSTWNFNKADELWLLEFQMRNSKEMVDRFLPASSCMKEPHASTSARSLPTSLQQETSDISPLHAHKSKRSKKFNIHIMPDIRERIRRHLEISDQLDKAAKQVLEENKDIGSVARNHKLDLWILNQKVQILKLRKEQLDELSRYQLAVNSVRFNIISVSDSVKRYNVDECFINMKLSELEYSENIMYIHLELKADLEVFNCGQEFSLLKCLRHLDKSMLPRKCCCRTCTLEYLPSWACKFASINNIQTPSPWNTNKKADEIWMYKFSMRHSIEIAKYFSHKCEAKEGLASASASSIFW